MSIICACPTCGFTRSYPSAAMADYHHSRHRCTKHLREAETARRRAERAAAGPKRDCQHAGAPHAHGTRVAYVKDRCRCVPCRAANAAASNTRHRARTFGRWHPFTDAAPARRHIIALRAAGIGTDRIAALTGLSASHIRALTHHGPDGQPTIQRIRPDTARRLLAVQPADANRAPRSHIDATGTHRRLQALIALGWTPAQLAAALGRTPTNLRRSISSQRVTIRTAAQVADLYARLCTVPPPQAPEAHRAATDAASRGNASDRGWRPSLICHDIEPDDAPDEAFAEDRDEIAVERAVAGDRIELKDLTLLDQIEAVRRLTERGKSLRDIAAQLATTPRTVARRRRGAAVSAA